MDRMESSSFRKANQGGMPTKKDKPSMLSTLFFEHSAY